MHKSATTPTFAVTHAEEEPQSHSIKLVINSPPASSSNIEVQKSADDDADGNKVTEPKP